MNDLNQLAVTCDKHKRLQWVRTFTYTEFDDETYALHNRHNVENGLPDMPRRSWSELQTSSIPSQRREEQTGKPVRRGGWVGINHGKVWDVGGVTPAGHEFPQGEPVPDPDPHNTWIIECEACRRRGRRAPVQLREDNLWPILDLVVDAGRVSITVEELARVADRFFQSGRVGQ